MCAWVSLWRTTSANQVGATRACVCVCARVCVGLIWHDHGCLHDVCHKDSILTFHEAQCGLQQGGSAGYISAQQRIYNSKAP